MVQEKLSRSSETNNRHDHDQEWNMEFKLLHNYQSYLGNFLLGWVDPLEVSIL